MITRATCVDLRADLQKAFEEIGAKYGLALTVGNMKFGPDRVEIKVAGAVTQHEGELYPLEATAYREHCTSYSYLDKSLQPEWLNKTVLYDGHAHQILGLDLKKVKYPVIIKKNDKIYFYTVASAVCIFRDGTPIR